MKVSLSLCLLLLATVAGCASSSQKPVPLADHVEINRMYGGWYIIATIPNRFERGMVAAYDVFSARADGDIQEDFYVQRGSFAAPRKHLSVHDWVRKDTNNAHWRVQIFWPVNLPFLVLYVDPEYRYALFGENNRAFGWIYSREPIVDESTYQQLLHIFAEKGYDISQFVRIVQKPEQIGQPGFWSEGITAAATATTPP